MEDYGQESYERGYEASYEEKPAGEGGELDLDSLFLDYERMRDEVIKKIKSKVSEHLKEKNSQIELLKGTLEARNKTIEETREKLNRILSGLG